MPFNLSIISSKGDSGGVIAGIVFAVVFFTSLFAGGLFLYYRRSYIRSQRPASRRINTLLAETAQAGHPGYSDVNFFDADRFVSGRPHREGAFALTADTLPSMYQTEPFILPPTSGGPIRILSRSSSSSSSERSEHSFLRHQEPLTPPQSPPDEDTNESRTSSHDHASQRRMPSRQNSNASSGALLRRRSTPAGPRSMGVPHPSSSDRQTNVTRDSRNFPLGEEPEEVDPFDSEMVDIPPTYHSFRRRRSAAGAGTSTLTGERERLMTSPESLTPPMTPSPPLSYASERR